MAKVATLREIKVRTSDVSINVVQSLSGIDGSRYDKKIATAFQSACDKYASDTSQFENVRTMAIILGEDALVVKASNLAKQDIKTRNEKLFETIIATSFPDKAKPSMTITRLKYIGKNIKHVDFLLDNFKKGNPENLDSKFVKLGTSFGAIGTFKNNLSDYISESEGTSKEPKAPLSETEKAINSVARAIEGLPLDEAQKLIVAIGIGALAKNVK